MNVVLISPYSQISSIGLRILSSCLKLAGFTTRMIFLPDIEEMMAGVEYSERQVPPEAMQQLVDLCTDAGLVGITVMTSSFRLARQLSEAIHAAHDVPIIWGGIHPTVRPEECLRYADLVCIGEGEESMVELAQRLAAGRDYHDVNNLAYLDEQECLVENPLYPLIRELDTLPLPDYDYADHYVLHEGEVVRVTQKLMEFYLSDSGAWSRGVIYGILTTRGCPYRCSFCVNNTMVGIYNNWSKLRMRSPQNVINEILDVRSRVPAIGGVAIRDDTFLANPKSYLLEFARLYKEQVNLPFQAYTTARTVDQEKLQILAEAGLRRLIMGLQTGSERVQKLYKRDWATNEQILAAARVINEFRHQIPMPMYDVITDSPYENDDDRFETLQLVHQLPQPYKLSIFSLTFYPGTEIHSRAVADGFFPAQEQAVYEHNFQKIQPTFYNLAIFLHHLNLPKPLLALLVQRPLFDLLSREPLNRLSGQVLALLMSLRLRSNQRLFDRRRAEWLANVDPASSYA
jgi:anaerobic magnesium-protoporphyrin IX monomethyl ester cyclase